jgi:hypothetical protein
MHCHEQADASEDCGRCHDCHWHVLPGMACSSPISGGSQECHEQCDTSGDCTYCHSMHESCAAEVAGFDQCYSQCDSVCPTHEQGHMHDPHELQHDCEMCKEHSSSTEDDYECADVCGLASHAQSDMVAPETHDGSFEGDHMEIMPPEGVVALPPGATEVAPAPPTASAPPAMESGKGKGKGGA